MPSPDPLLDAYRIMRRLDGPPDAPYAGLLAHDAAMGASVLVEADALGEDWLGWRASPNGHLLGPLDIVRTGDGHVVALPVCTERLDDFLARRVDAPLSDGERLTLAVSLLRGSAEAAALQDEGCLGTWWLAEGGLPVFASIAGGDEISSATDTLLDHLARGAGHPLAAALGEAREVAAEPRRLARSLARLEDLLFSTASPEALAITVFAPRRVRHEGSLGERSAPADAADAEPRRRTLLSQLAGHVDADLADALSQATTAVWRRFRRDGAEPAGRRRPLLVAGIAAAVVVLGGLLWPTGAAGPATAQSGSKATAPSSSTPDPVVSTTAEDAQTPPAAPDEEAGQTPAAADEASLESVVDALLTARTACGEDPGCLAPLLENPSSALPPGAIDLPSSGRSVTLLDEFGGAAVLRVAPDGAAGTAQLVVIVRRDEKWVLRDVHDVTEHPQ
ncbi:hypothetical protein AAIB33_05785 [Microbacterium sp. AZCO]|uniref:hypothetical protein n=1 Tax=Microbacterium sp. AZCO TaxID=3142976 RepID=UPI0031F337A1